MGRPKRQFHIPNRKDEVDTRCDRGGWNAYPCVNVKAHGWHRDVELPLHLSRYSTDGGVTFIDSFSDAEFTHDYIEQVLEDQNPNYPGWFEAACEAGWESLREDADVIFDQWTVDVCQEGRSGGWAVVRGLPEIDTWDAVLFAKWRKFCRYARCQADAVWDTVADLIYVNVYEREQEEKAEQERQAIAAAEFAVNGPSKLRILQRELAGQGSLLDLNLGVNVHVLGA